MNNLIARIQAILLKPKEEWVTIKSESTPVMTLFMKVVIPLAAIPAVCQFIGNALIGRRIPYLGAFRYPLGSALFQAILFYALTVVSVYVAGMVVNALAPSFGSKANLENAMKLVVYGMIPGWLAGVFHILPALGVLAFIAALYGLYILYLGFQTPMMDTPQDKVIPYMVVSFLVIVGLMIVVGVVIGAIFAVGSMAGF
ncbi:MAG: YIP1 family protein [Candidatus Aminicenantes bacterium]|nr:YIP1 family protein [Candidatus Aminicenantes bacterium]